MIYILHGKIFEECQFGAVTSRLQKHILNLLSKSPHNGELLYYLNRLPFESMQYPSKQRLLGTKGSIVGTSQALKGFRNVPDKRRGITNAMLAGIYHLQTINKHWIMTALWSNLVAVSLSAGYNILAERAFCSYKLRALTILQPRRVITT